MRVGVGGACQMGYVSNHQQTEYQALQVVSDSLKSKFAQANLLDDRLDGYMDGYRRVLEADFSIDQRFKTIAQQFNTTSVALTELIKAISGQAETLLNEEFMAAQTIRERLKYSFMVSSALSALALLLILDVQGVVDLIQCLPDLGGHCRNVVAHLVHGGLDVGDPSF